MSTEIPRDRGAPQSPIAPNGPARSTVTRWVLIGAAIVIVIALALTFWPRSGGTPAAAPSPSASNFHPITESPTPDPVVTPVAPDPTTTPDPVATFIPNSRKPVALADSVTIIDGVTVKITSVAAVAGVGTGPGDVNAPSVQVRMTVKNSTTKTINLGNTVVNAYYGSAHTPASQLPRPGGVAFPSTVKAGKSAQGVFVFSIPKNQRSLVSVSFDYSVKTKVVVFQGSAPK